MTQPRRLRIAVIGAGASGIMAVVKLREAGHTDVQVFERASDIDPRWIEGVSVLGLTAGASAPESLVREVVERLREWREVSEEVVETAQERMTFKLPRQLADD